MQTGGVLGLEAESSGDLNSSSIFKLPRSFCLSLASKWLLTLSVGSLVGESGLDRMGCAYSSGFKVVGAG